MSAGAGALLISFFTWRLHSYQMETDRKLERETAALRARLNESETRTANGLNRMIAQRVIEAQAPSVPAPHGDQTAAVQDATTQGPIGAPSAAAARTLEIAKKLDEYASSEQVDPEWSAASTEGAKSAFVDVAGSRIQSADCRTKLCRFVITSDSKDDQLAIARQITGVGPFAEDVWYHYDYESTPPRATLYVSRHGVPLMSVIGNGK